MVKLILAISFIKSTPNKFASQLLIKNLKINI